MNTVGSHMPLLRSLRDRVARVATTMPLLTELSASRPRRRRCAGDAYKVQRPRAQPARTASAHQVRPLLRPGTGALRWWGAAAPTTAAFDKTAPAPSPPDR